ncbi:PRC-barrel domain-containing protein [Sulfitobacter sp. PS-8MA]|uniref:PRC-barrel domain-containing protein n=1 Tax=Sulfitobacter sp. PS-8MA TaxID=3237707 RepID=UPI0034C6DAE8
MKRIAVSTFALIIAAAGAATADQHAGDRRTYSGIITNETSPNTLRAEGMIGSAIYTFDAEYDESEWSTVDYFDAVDPGWEEIGEVEDIIISRDGRVVGLIAEIGGWLDIGDEEVVIDMKDLRAVGDNVGDVSFVTRLREEQLEARQEVDQAWGW